MNFRQKFERFMYGRYGTDKLSVVMIWSSLSVMIVNSFINSLVLYIIQMLLLGYAFFRMFSRNVGKRYEENRKFEVLIGKILSSLKLHRLKQKEKKTHVFTKCPHCKVNLRLPRKKGKHTVNCPKCHKRFEFNCK